MASENRYEHLKLDQAGDMSALTVAEQRTEKITCDNTETITIQLARLNTGRWAYGYIVYWADGRTSCLAPDPENGIFESQRTATLHAVGFMSLYSKYFTPPTRKALQMAEQRLLQASLF